MLERETASNNWTRLGSPQFTSQTRSRQSAGRWKREASVVTAQPPKLAPATLYLLEAIRGVFSENNEFYPLLLTIPSGLQCIYCVFAAKFKVTFLKQNKSHTKGTLHTFFIELKSLAFSLRTVSLKLLPHTRTHALRLPYGSNLDMLTSPPDLINKSQEQSTGRRGTFLSYNSSSSAQCFLI